jgi:hypothetical protein
MSQKSDTATIVADFKKRFPTPADFSAWLLTQPNQPRKTVVDFQADVVRRQAKEHPQPDPTPDALA